MELSRSYHVSRLQNSKARRRTPIAAGFEDCIQVFHQLCSSFEAGSTAWGGSDGEFGGLFGRLRAWGNESGASTRSLDHRLRKASRLQKQVLEFLVDLKIDIENGMSSPHSCSLSIHCKLRSTSVLYFHTQKLTREFSKACFPYFYNQALDFPCNPRLRSTHCVKRLRDLESMNMVSTRCRKRLHWDISIFPIVLSDLKVKLDNLILIDTMGGLRNEIICGL